MRSERWETVTADEVPSKQIEWLMPEFIPYGFITGLAGKSGRNKSTLLYDLASRITLGKPMPRIGNDEPQDSKPGLVIILSVEDHKGTVTKPRLGAAGARLDRIHFPVYRRPAKGSSHLQLVDNLAHNIGYLRQYIRDIERTSALPVRMIIIDPLSSFAGKLSTKTEQGIRTLLEPLARLAEERNIAVVNVFHLTKGTGQAESRVMGGSAMVNISRSFLFVGKDVSNPNRRFLMIEKCSFGIDEERRAVAFGITAVDRVSTRVSWESAWEDVDLEEVIKEKVPQRVKSEEAKELMHEWLREKPMRSTALRQKLEAAGISWGTGKIAKKELELETHKGANGVFWTRLPGQKESAVQVQPQPSQPIHRTGGRAKIGNLRTGGRAKLGKSGGRPKVREIA